MPASPPALHFGGPDREPRALSSLLQRLVRESLPGDEIRWVTYYFRDRPLARALMDASDRGVRVSLFVEGTPRRRHANRAVLEMLSAHGLGGGLCVSTAAGWPGKLHPHLHAKLYLFTGVRPCALLGSFNPSGDDPEEDPDTIAEIGDQDRGHNMLVAIRDAEVVRALQRQAMLWRERAGSPLLRFSSQQNRVIEADSLRLYFYPRMKSAIAEHAIARLAAGDRIAGALSHIKPGPFTRALCDAASRGVAVNLVVHDTERRVPEAMLQDMRARGVRLRRYRHPDGLPVHAKYLLLERGSAVRSYFGSYNFNTRSRLLNIELLAECDEPAINAALQARFAALEAEVDAQEAGRNT